MTQVKRSPLLRYIVPLLLVLLVAAVTWLVPTMGQRIPFALFYIPVIVAALFYGRGPAISAIALSTLLATYLFLPPVQSFDVGVDGIIRIITFDLIALMVSLVIERIRRAEAQARESRDQLLTTLRSIGDAVIATDATGRVTFLNEAAQALTGWTLEEAKARELREVFQIVNEQTRDEISSPVEAVLRDGLVVNLANHTLLLSKDGRETPIDDSVAPIRNQDGEITGVVLVFRDITERRRSEETSQRLASIVESSDAAIFGKTLDGIVTSWNASARRLYGYTSEEIVGQPVSMLVPSDRPDEVPQILDSLRRGGKVEHLETKRVTKDGRVRDVALTISPIKSADGTIIGASTIASDITERKASEEALRKSEARFRRLVESNLIGVSFATTDGEVTDANDAYLQMLGHTREELRAGRVRWDELTPPEYLSLDARAIEEIKANGACVPFEKEHIRKDGTRIPVLIGSARLDDAGQDCVCFIVDLTEQKRAANRTARLQAITAALSEALTPTQVVAAVLDHGLTALGAHAGSIVVLVDNQDELELLGAAGFPDELLEKWRRFSLSSDVPLAEAVRTGKMVLIESLEARNSRYPQLSGLPIFNGSMSLAAIPLIIEGRTIGGMGLIFTEARSFQEDDRAFMLAIAHQCAQALERARLYQAERRMRSEAEEANRTKDEFLATLSHELRTPLTAMLGWTRMLRSKELDEKTTMHALETVERNARAQAQLIEDLLDVSRIITGNLRLDVRPVELLPVIESAIDSIRPAANAKGIALQATLDPLAGPVSGDPARLQQIVWNLLSNAIKFTKSDGQVFVRLHRTGAHVEVEVSDTGQGISREFLPYVFDRFRQADSSTTRMHGGLGLGLAIVRHLVELHGGTVHATSDGAGLGASFKVELPLMVQRVTDFRLRNEEAIDSESLTRSPAAESLAGLRVLIVDDEADALELMKAVLENQGARVLTAPNAPAALEAFEHERPDVLISDIGMPDVDGYDLIRRIRARSEAEGGNTPAAAVSAYVGEENRRLALAAGFNLHLAKPLEPSELIAVVRTLAERKKGSGREESLAR